MFFLLLCLHKEEMTERRRRRKKRRKEKYVDEIKRLDFSFLIQQRERVAGTIHRQETVDCLRKFNARRKLKVNDLDQYQHIQKMERKRAQPRGRDTKQNEQNRSREEKKRERISENRGNIFTVQLFSRRFFSSVDIVFVVFRSYLPCRQG